MVEFLVVARHAEAAAWDPTLRDASRPLTAKGHSDAEAGGRWLSKWLAERGLRLDRVVSSPAVRARETTRRLVDATGFSWEDVVWVDPVYGATVPVLLEVLREQAGTAGTLLLVGHNPGLSDLVGRLLKERGGFQGLSPGAVVVLHLQGEHGWEGNASLLGWFAPAADG